MCFIIINGFYFSTVCSNWCLLRNRNSFDFRLLIFYCIIFLTRFNSNNLSLMFLSYLQMFWAFSSISMFTLHYFSCLITLAINLYCNLNSSDSIGHPYLAPDFNGNFSKILQLSTMLKYISGRCPLQSYKSFLTFIIC